MAISATDLKEVKDTIRGVPNTTTQLALFKMLEALTDVIDEQVALAAILTAASVTPIADGDINTAATATLSTVNGIITAAA